MNDVKLGALCWNQYTDWPSLLEAGIRAERLGYSSLWTWDHLYPIVGSHEGPMFEAWLTLAAWAQRTERVRLGLMVGANTFRNPAVGQDGPPRPPVGWARDAGHRRLARRPSTAFGLEFGEGRQIGCAGWARPCPSSAACSAARRPALPARITPQEVRNDPPP
jgi:hypothetical protein